MKVLVAIFVLWLPFSLLALAAIPICLVAIVFDEMPYGKNVLKAQDRLVAALLGYSGTRTLSAEMGRSQCRLCKIVCKMLDVIEPGHCQRADAKES